MENENETETETITYQGREIEAEVIGYINAGNTWGNRMVSNVTLYRDAAGIYYLQRESFAEDEPMAQQHGVLPLDEDPSYRCIVHRIGINAAILWAVGELGNGNPWSLRVDAGRLIRPDAGYSDPNDVYTRYLAHKQAADVAGGKRAARVEPVVKAEGPLSSVTSPGWFDGCIQPEEGSGARVRTIFDVDPLHAVLLRVFTERYKIDVATLVRACLVLHLEEMFDHPFNGGENERVSVENLREYGRIAPPLKKKEVRERYRAAGLRPADLTTKEAA